MQQEVINLIPTVGMLFATVILAVITGWYAVSTARMLAEMRRHGRLLAISVAASVQAGMMQLPSPGNISSRHNEILGELEYLEKQINRLLKEFDVKPNPFGKFGVYPNP